MIPCGCYVRGATRSGKELGWGTVVDELFSSIFVLLLYRIV